jgi:hypothetical protein
MAMSKFPLLLLCLAIPAFAGSERVDLVTTDRADVTPGGLIRIEGSTGELNIVGWDQPSVEVMTDRYTFREARDKEKAIAKLKRIEVVKKAAGSGELTIATMKHESRIHVDYQIMVPRTSRLVIRHHIGDVVITDVAGDIDAKAGTGDILVQLPEKEHYTINAKTGIGGVYSDFNESRHTFVGHKLIQDASTGGANGPAHKIDLHVSIGGISIQKKESAAQAGTSTPAGL